MASNPKLFADGFVFLEAPRWHDQRLWVSDVFGRRVYALSADGKERHVVCEVPNRPSGLGFLPDGSLIIVSAADRRLLRWDGTDVATYADLSNHAAGYVNDFAVDAKGRIFVGNFGYDFDGGEAPRTTLLHRVDPDGAIVTVAEGVQFPNGSVIINGGRTLVVAETWIGKITAFDLSEEGWLNNRRTFADLGPRQPDGICADAEGAIWAGCFNTGEFVRVLDGGEITHRLGFDGAGISCVLGGADGNTLFLTTYLGTREDIAAGLPKSAVFIVEVDVPSPS